MAVKDLVQLFETPLAADTDLDLRLSTSTRIDSAGTTATGRSRPQSPSFVLDRDLPAPQGARFLPLMRNMLKPGAVPRASTTSTGTTNTHLLSTAHDDNSLNTTVDITDSANDAVTISSEPFPSLRSRNNSKFKSYSKDRENDDYESEFIGLLEQRGRVHPQDAFYHNSDSDTLLYNTSALTNNSYPPLRSHTPIAAPVVFARRAAPLHLPLLDKYLASIPRPRFLDEEGGTLRSPGMFPPMDKLVKLGKTIDDLEANYTPPPAWRNRKSILGSGVNIALGLLGSSALASFYSLQGLLNTMQIFALMLSTIVPLGGKNLEDKWRKLFLGTIPNVLALNFVSTTTESLILLLIFMTIGAGLLYYFYRFTFHCDRYNSTEGLQHVESKGNQWGLVIVTFFLTVIYLPLSTMAVHVLVWSEDLWAITNPYTNATAFPPTVPSLGPSNEFRDPLDFCWTTTMKRNQVNYAPFFFVCSFITVVFLTIWFPIALRHVIERSVPKIDTFTELGRPRNNADLDAEYHRLLARDRNPFAFLYNAFRRGWATYESTYLFAKLSTLLIIAIVDANNCLFRTFSRSTIPIVRQVLLLASTIGFFIVQCLFAPFLDPVNNASEWTSRLNYVATATTALAIALNAPGKDIINSYVLYAIYIVTYGLSFYFTAINLNITQRLVKRLMRRIDFSIDIFSPRLDISANSIHTKRRIWQESITTLLLTTPDCQIPQEQAMTYAEPADSKFPPYLLDFCGTPGERHVENLKILREVGSLAYGRAVALVYGPDFAFYNALGDEIQQHYVGPDCYWKNTVSLGCSSYFGNAWWIPFPPTLVIQYDDGPLAVLQDAAQLKAYIAQNSSLDIQTRKYVRMSLRALEGQKVLWPFEHIKPVGGYSYWCCVGHRYKAISSTQYQSCILRIRRRGHLLWRKLHLGSGFDVELKYSKKVCVSGDIIGLNDDYDLTSTLARFLEWNRELIDKRLHLIEDSLSSYRLHHRRECQRKIEVLTYRFLAQVYDQPQESARLAHSSIKMEQDLRVRQMILNSESVFETAYKRLDTVSRSEAAVLWYIFWDDLWRRNYDTISALETYAGDFNPHYPTSIAYTPLPRAALESFLSQRGLLHKKPKWTDFFNSGFLNKLYMRLNEVVYRDTSQAIGFHLGRDGRELDMEDVDALTQGQPSTLGTGGGTDHDDNWIRARPRYRWEGLLDEPLHKSLLGKQWWLEKLGAWFGVTPLWRSHAFSDGIYLDLHLENGRYNIINDARSERTLR